MFICNYRIELILRPVGLAFSIIGIFLMAFAIEGTRRGARNYDRMLSAKHASVSKAGVVTS
jgi:hypothetical protein